MDGFLLVDKTIGPTSHDIVAIARKKLGTKKIGHSGTLDPIASGLMILGINKGTRLLEYLIGADKSYEAEILLGVETDTYDIEGKVLSRKEVSDIKADRIKFICSSFIGTIKQKPPIYSALKINGRKACDIARKGDFVDVKEREVVIKKIDIIGFNKDILKISVECGSGTYIRSLAHDIGSKIGCGACIKNLRRTSINSFRVDDACSLNNISNENIIDILTVLKLFLPIHEISLDEVRLIATGRSIVKDNNIDGDIALVNDNQLIAIANSSEGFFKPRKVFVN